MLTLIVGKRKLTAGDRGIDSDARKTAQNNANETENADAVNTAEVTANTDAACCAESEKTRKDRVDALNCTAGKDTLTAFLTGEIIPLKEVNDGVFSEGIMGEGVAIIPENDTLYAPADAQVTVLMDESRHACGLKLDNDMEILLHIGIDTVEMNGEGFEYLVSLDQKVKAGTPLVHFDREKIKAAGHPDVTVCIVTEEGSAKNIQFKTGMYAKAGKTEIAKFEE